MAPEVASYLEGQQHGDLHAAAVHLSNAFMAMRWVVGAIAPSAFWTSMRSSHAFNAVVGSALVGHSLWAGATVFLFDPKLGAFGAAALICGQLTAAVAFNPQNRARIARFFRFVPKLVVAPVTGLVERARKVRALEVS